MARAEHLGRRGRGGDRRRVLHPPGTDGGQRLRRILNVVLLGDDVFELVDEVVEVPAGAVQHGFQLRLGGRLGRRAQQRGAQEQREEEGGENAHDPSLCTILQPSQGDTHAATRTSSRSHGARHRPCARAGSHRLHRSVTRERRRRPSAVGAQARRRRTSGALRLAAQEAGRSRDEPALVNEAVQLAIAADTPGPHDMTQFLTNSFGKEPFFTPGRSDQGSRSGQRPHHAPRLHRRGVGRPETRGHHQQRHQDVPDDGGRAGVAARADQGRQRLRAGLHAAARRSVRGAAQRRRSSGTICCGRRATGRGRCGAGPTGRIVRSARRWPSRRTASSTSRDRISSTTTCA